MHRAHKAGRAVYYILKRKEVFNFEIKSEYVFCTAPLDGFLQNP